MAYRIVRESEEEFESDPALLLWAVDIEGRRIPTTEKSYRRRMMAHILAERPVVRDRFSDLVEGGCDRTSLRAVLESLVFRAKSLSRQDFEKAAETLQQAAEAVSQIGWSAHADQVDPGGRFLGLDSLLHDYASQITSIAPAASKRSLPTRDEALARLIAHVKVRTGRFQDEVVAELVNAVEMRAKTTNVIDGRPRKPSRSPKVYLPSAHIKWRQRHESLIEKHIAAEQESYTTWRDWRAADRGPKGLKGKGPMQRYVPDALQAARQLHPELDWRQYPRRRLSRR